MPEQLRHGPALDLQGHGYADHRDAEHRNVEDLAPVCSDATARLARRH
jgi:hypothetical protein